MENPAKSWVDVLLCVIGPLKPEQAPLVLAAAVQVLRELPERWNGKLCGADVEGRLIELASYCEKHHIPHGNCDIFSGTNAVFLRNIRTPLDCPPGQLTALDRRTYPRELIVSGTDVLYLFYAPGRNALRDARRLRKACQAAGGCCVLCPI